ncbi:Nramp family divalent metal transporter [Candidatus Dojkabacteria bacterium]|uniref:Nramp family divalent metal transporter n=1 Tax=Candidatus Dojkabacteria bacterium TaxID=2099670 RepID=A0A955L1N4_9BACT|nr:Nramp family divalent metal transporter [Candidatus Dojkabacteria bacterium]
MKKTIPKAPKLTLAFIGPGIVLIAMGLGSGEFILWPYLVAQFGFGVIWGALVGITAQYFVSNESGRYTLSTGGSVYTAFAKLNKLIPSWFIISTFASFAWPGIIGAGGTIFAHLFDIADARIPTIVMLLIIGLLLTFSGKVYTNLKNLQKFFVAVSIPVLFFIALALVDLDTITNITKGLVGIGNNYFLFPEGIPLMAFLGAVAYSGAAGNLILSHSFYVQDEGRGMAKYLDTQMDSKNLSNKNRKMIPEGIQPEESEENIGNFKQWFKISAFEQLFSFWFLGMVTIILLTIISFKLTFPYSGEEGLGFVFLQENALNIQFGSLVGLFFMITGITFLFTTQLGVFETTSRIMTENLQLASDKILHRFNRDSIYFLVLWIQVLVAIAITLLGLDQPIQLLVIQTFFSALSMFVLSGLIFWLNNSKLIPESMQPGFFRQLMVIASTLFFGAFVVFTLLDTFGLRF